MDILFDGEGMEEKFNIVLAERPVIPVAEALYNEYPVPGRNGMLKEFDRFENTEFPLRFNYINKHAKPTFIEMVNWLQGRKIYKESDNKFYRIMAQSLIDVTPANNDIADWCDFEINVETEPFWYEDAGIVTVTNKDTVINPSKLTAGIFMRVFGTGTCGVKINDNLMEFSDVQGSIDVDGINKTRYEQYNRMSGRYPELISGENEIELRGNTEKVEIELRWCWR